MNSEPDYRPVYRSLNIILTLGGIERKLFFCIALIAIAIFQTSANLVPSVCAFVFLWLAALTATKHDPQLLKVLIKASRFASRYDPSYRDGKD